MNSKTIYGIVAAIVMAAGFIAVQPLQQAAAVHTTILASTTQVRTITLAAKQQATPMTATITCDVAYSVQGARITTTHDNALDNFSAPTLTVNTSPVALTAALDPAANADINEAITGSVSSGPISSAGGTNVVVSVANTAANGANDFIIANVQVLTSNAAVCSVT